ncbi:MAG: SCO family protein, partial [Candidatus Rokuibacteriota bacterium]
LALVAVLASGAAPTAPPARLGPAPNFALTTQRNDRLWLTHLRDRVVVLTFFCTDCPSCPGVLPALLETARATEGAGRRLFFVAVSVDPARDSPAVLRAFARARGADPAAWLFLTGRPAEVEAVARRYDVAVRPGPAGPTHDCLAVLIDAAGVVRGRYDAAGLTRLRSDLDALLPR